MTQTLNIRLGSSDALAGYTARQLQAHFPLADDSLVLEQLRTWVPAALERIRPILSAAHAFEPEQFNHLNALQYTTFLYLLANEAWRAHGHSELAERLFCLNRALNAIDLFYTVDLPEVFLISHGLGAVLGNVSYGNRLVVFQNVTVGRVGDDRPSVGANVVLFPGAVITGRTVIGDGSVVAAGTVLHGIEVPSDVVARQRDGRLEFLPRNRDYTALYFRSAS